jgi:predicted enzyme related to lactoylglutathione lyase
MAVALYVNCLSVDCRDPRSVAQFWSQALDWPILEDDDDDEVMVAPGREPVPGKYPLLFVRVPDEKTAKNRWHLDLSPEDQSAEVARLEGLGARRVDIGQGDQTWVVMSDPEGNEFCVLRSLPPGT